MVAPFHFSFFHCGKKRSEEHTSELQSRRDLVCRLLLEKKKHGFEPREQIGGERHLVLPMHFWFHDVNRTGAAVFFFNDTAPTEIYPLPLHRPLPIPGNATPPTIARDGWSRRAWPRPATRLG